MCCGVPGGVDTRRFLAVPRDPRRISISRQNSWQREVVVNVNFGACQSAMKLPFSIRPAAYKQDVGNISVFSMPEAQGSDCPQRPGTFLGNRSFFLAKEASGCFSGP